MSGNTITIAGKSLTIRWQNGTESSVDFDWPVAQVLDFETTVVVRTEPNPGACSNENVFGVSMSGHITWQIKRGRYVYDDSPYTGMSRVGDEVWLMNWDGLELLVNPTTGEVLQERHGR